MKNYQFNRILSLLYIIWGVATKIELLGIFLLIVGLIYQLISVYQEIKEMTTR